MSFIVKVMIHALGIPVEIVGFHHADDSQRLSSNKENVQSVLLERTPCG